jgi:hypothetical protein
VTILINLSLALLMVSCLIHPHDRSYIVFNLETNIVIKSCDVIFDETALYSCDVFKYICDKKIKESIFIDKFF